MAEEACSDILLQKKITTRQDHVILQVIVAVYSNLARFHTRVPQTQSPHPQCRSRASSQADCYLDRIQVPSDSESDHVTEGQPERPTSQPNTYRRD